MAEKDVKPSDEKKPAPVSKIMTKPLPQILDELEDSIIAVNEATRAAGAAADDARKAAEEARKAGEKAASEAARVAAEAIVRVEAMAKAAMKMAELVGMAVTDAAASAQKRLAERK